MNVITARKRSCGQVMFLQVSVILPTGGGVLGPGEGSCSREAGAWWRPPGRLLLRAVRILLECILVY